MNFSIFESRGVTLAQCERIRAALLRHRHIEAARLARAAGLEVLAQLIDVGLYADAIQMLSEVSIGSG